MHQSLDARSPLADAAFQDRVSDDGVAGRADRAMLDRRAQRNGPVLDSSADRLGAASCPITDVPYHGRISKP